MTRTQQRTTLAIQMAYPHGDGQQSVLAHFTPHDARTHSTPSLVDLDNMTYTCPTELAGLSMRLWTHCLHGTDSHNCYTKKRSFKRISQQSSQVDMTQITTVQSPNLGGRDTYPAPCLLFSLPRLSLQSPTVFFISPVPASVAVGLCMA